jgi:hypothetical protein
MLIQGSNKRLNMKTHLLFIGGSKNELSEFLDALGRVPEDDGFKCTYALSVAQSLEMLKYLVPDQIFLNDVVPEDDCRHFMSVVALRPKLESTKIHLYGGDESIANKLGIQGCIRKCETTEELTLLLTPILAHGKLLMH